MFQRLLDTLVGIPAGWAYALLFLFNFLETAAFAGFVVPGETAVVICGLLAARGVLRLEWVIVIASLGAILGDSVGFWIGRRYGSTVLLRFGRYVRIQPRHLEEAKGFFTRHGGKAVFLGRFTAWLRAMTPVTAGISEMPYRPFLLYNVTGGVVWASTFSLLGYFVGQSWELVGKWIGRAGLAAFVMVIAGLYLASLARKKKRTLRIFLVRLDRTLAAELPRIWPPLRRRFEVGAWYGLHLTISFVVILLACHAFVELTGLWMGRSALDHLDAQAQMLVARVRAPWLTLVMKVVTLLGWSAIPVVVLCAGVGLWIRQKRWALYAWLTVLAGGGLLIYVLKLFFHRARPAPELVLAHGYSFPSGHAAASVLVYGFLAVLIWRSPIARGWRVAAVSGFMLLTFLVGLSRLYLHVHYLTDVLAGYIMGVAWTMAVLLIFRALREHRHAFEAP